MKVLFIGHYRDGHSGWANVAKEYILAMDSVGIDVVPAAIKLNESEPDVPERILELEKKSKSGCNIVIHCTLPHHYRYDGRFKKNIGILFPDSNNIRFSPWRQYCSMMDECWVPHEHAWSMMRGNGIANAYVLSPPVNTDKYYQNYDPLPSLKEQLGGDFTFYFIGDLNYRKNLSGLIKAFHLEFTPTEPVSLVLKVSKYGKSDQEMVNEVVNIAEQVKTYLRLYPSNDLYKKEMVITSDLSETEVCQLHQTCDCLVAPSFSEAWGMHIIDAIGFGKLPITTSGSGPDTYKNPGMFLLRSTKEPCFAMPDTFPFLFTGREQWNAPNKLEIGRTMRMVYEMEKGKREQLTTEGLTTLERFSYKNIGQQIKERLEK